jgi:DNA invertase Pin-like site-specific DNA recombinase
MTRTAIYCRVSTPGQKNTTSLPEQERLCREKAARLGYEVSEAHVYHEIESGSDLYRPEMERLWAAIERHAIDALVIDVLDRLSRDEGDVGAVYHHADRHGVTIELASEDRDETEKGRMMRTLSGMVARMERADIMRRTQRGRRARAARGDLFPASVPLYGYLWADEQHTAYIPDPETAPVIVRIWRRIAEGVSIRAVARELDADGIPTPAQLLRQRGLLPAARPDPTDKGWHPGSIARMLRHPAYVGQHAAYRFAVSATKERSHATGVTYKVTRMRERALDDPNRVALPPETCPALIEPELAARVHAQLALNKANSAGNNPDPLATLFRGMTYCGHCGDKMGTSKSAGAHGGDGWPQRRCYRCNSARVPGRAPCPGGMHSVAASVLDPAAWADIVEWLSNPKNVARLMDEWQQQEQHAQSSITSRMDAVNAN